MDIKYLGHASFQIKGKTGSVITDPFDPKMVGLKFPSVAADIVTISHDHPDHNMKSLVTGTPLIIDIPGEYEKQKVRVTGWGVYHDSKNGAERGKNTIYKIEVDDVSILHCGDLGHTLSEELVEEIGPVDVLLIPVGGFFTIGPDEANQVIHEIEPSIVIPMHYNDPKLNQATFAKLAPLSDFLTKAGVSQIEPVKKLSLKKADMTEDMKVVVMEITN